MNSEISVVHAREVFDRKGLPSVEVEVTLAGGCRAMVIAAGGSSRGSGEPADVRDGDRAYFGGMGVNQAVKNVNTEIAEELIGQNAADQEKIDNLLIELDGTPDKSRLGGNSIVATSIAMAKAAAQSKGVKLFEHLGGGGTIPICHVNVMYGGPAYCDIEGTVDFQTYALDALSAGNYKDGFVKAIEIYHRFTGYLVNDRGIKIPRLPQLGGVPMARFDGNKEAFAILTNIVEDAGYTPGKDFGLFVDIAGTELFENGKYYLECDGQAFSPEEWIDWLINLCDEFPIITTLEDPLTEDDWDGWRKLTAKIGAKVQLVGDDLFVTNPRLLTKGIENGCANGIIIKPNQVGTLTETFEAIKLAKSAGYGTAISGRSGEMFDPYLAHLCVGQNLGQAKMVSAPAGLENLNEVLRIEDYLGGKAHYMERGNLPGAMSG